MKVIIAPDSFKESLSAAAVAEAIAAGVQAEMPLTQCLCLPMADGGEGTTEVLVNATGGEFVPCQVHDALGHEIEAYFGMLDETTAALEMASAAGLDLVDVSQRRPLKASTYGVGEMLNIALNKGVQKLIIGLGGSMTNDAGAGLLQALGVRLLDAEFQELPWGGEALARLARIDVSGLDKRWQQVEIIIASDVDNPLCGVRGASATFGPQKGATPEMVAILDAALAHFARCCEQAGFRACQHIAGAGAAGGLGFALLTFLGAKIVPGVDVVMDAIGLDDALQDADLVITGEGKFDGQTAAGKVPQGVLQRAQKYQVPCVAICGAVEQTPEEMDRQAFLAVLPTLAAVDSWEKVQRETAANLQRTTRQVMRLLAQQL